MNHEQGLYLEDLYVGQRFTSGTYRMDEERIKAFAAEFDPQPFHLDQVAAQATAFGGLSASGWHTAAVTMRLTVTEVCLWALGSSGSAASWTGPNQPGREIPCGWKARSSRFCPPGPNQTRRSLK